MAIHTAVPEVSGDVRDKLLKFKQAGPTVEEAHAAMLAAKEPVTTSKGGTRVPKFVQKPNSAIPPVVESRASLLESAHNKINNLRVPAGSRINLNKMREAGLITQPEIDALMAEANGTKSATEEPAPAVPVNVESLIETVPSTDTPVVTTSQVEVPATPERVPVAPVVPVTPPVSEKAPAEVNDGRKTIETKYFTGQIYRDGKEWVAEIVYKNGAGSERFTADSKDSLMLKLVEGKGFGTVKVRDTVRRMKLGDKPDGWDFFFGQVKESHGLTVEQYNALPEASRDLIQDTIQAQQILAFHESNPNYYATDKNFKIIADYLNKKEIPLTLHNLELAYNDLMEDELLELRPSVAAPVVPAAPAVTTVPAVPVAPAVEDSASAAAASAPVVSTAAAPAPPVATPRKRGSTGLIPGSSSAAPAEVRIEEGIAPKEPSEAELKRMPIDQLAGLAKRGRKYGVGY